jgi:hypothetical protein
VATPHGLVAEVAGRARAEVAGVRGDERERIAVQDDMALVVRMESARPAPGRSDGSDESTPPPLSAAGVKGRRLPSGFLRHGDFRPGDYQVVTAGSDNVLGLWVLPPCGGYPRHVTARRHIEHGDGTVSIEGMILFDGWEGFLERGVWRLASAGGELLAHGRDSERLSQPEEDLWQCG